MAKTQRFTFLCNIEERRVIAELARRLERNQSDVVRWLIREAARELEADPQPAKPAGEVQREPQAA